MGNESELKKQLDDNRIILKALYRWIGNLHDGKSMSKYLEKRGYHEIVIYGMGYLGDKLYEELLESSVKVKCVVDKRALDIGINEGVSILLPTDDIPKADAMIITTITAYLQIFNMMSQKVDYPILSLEELIYEM